MAGLDTSTEANCRMPVKVATTVPEESLNSTTVPSLPVTVASSDFWVESVDDACAIPDDPAATRVPPEIRKLPS
jgi:hypothetical protein